MPETIDLKSCRSLGYQLSSKFGQVLPYLFGSDVHPFCSYETNYIVHHLENGLQTSHFDEKWKPNIVKITQEARERQQLFDMFVQQLKKWSDGEFLDNYLLSTTEQFSFFRCVRCF